MEKIYVHIAAGFLCGIIKDGKLISGEVGHAENHVKDVSQRFPCLVVETIVETGIISREIA